VKNPLLLGSLWIALASLLAGLVLRGPADEASESANEEASDFLRFTEGKKGEGQLETAIVSYSGEDGVVVDLIAAVHVADAAYYRDLQKRFERYDSLLYEMIKPEGVQPTAGASGGLLSFFQRGLKDTLGLEFQLDAVDYGKENFVHADLDPATFSRLQQQKGESIFTLLLKAMEKSLELQQSREKKPLGLIEILALFTSPDRQSSLKLFLAGELEDMEKILAGMEEGTEGGSVIVAERNKVVMAALRAGLKAGKKKFGVFYGGGHMPDLEQRIQTQLGVQKRKQEWVTAWDIKTKTEAKESGTGTGTGTESG
jgi:hypothetical protein